MENAMNIKACCSLVAMAVVVLICRNANAYAQDIKHTRNTLRGVSGVYVTPEKTQEQDAIRGGLSQDTIRTDVEPKLSFAGILVLSGEEWEQETGRPN